MELDRRGDDGQLGLVPQVEAFEIGVDGDMELFQPGEMRRALGDGVDRSFEAEEASIPSVKESFEIHGSHAADSGQHERNRGGTHGRRLSRRSTSLNFLVLG